jgi:hypothetical protein
MIGTEGLYWNELYNGKTMIARGRADMEAKAKTAERLKRIEHYDRQPAKGGQMKPDQPAMPYCINLSFCKYTCTNGGEDICPLTNPKECKWYKATKQSATFDRQYAAIHLCVPDSGNDELDAMIRRAQRERLAGQAMTALLNRQYLDVPVCPRCKTAGDDPGKHYAEVAGAYADALIAAGEVGK